MMPATTGLYHGSPLMAPSYVYCLVLERLVRDSLGVEIFCTGSC